MQPEGPAEGDSAEIAWGEERGGTQRVEPYSPIVTTKERSSCERLGNSRQVKSGNARAEPCGLAACRMTCGVEQGGCDGREQNSGERLESKARDEGVCRCAEPCSRYVGRQLKRAVEKPTRVGRQRISAPG